MLVDIVSYSYETSQNTAPSSGSSIINNWRIQLMINDSIFYEVILEPNSTNPQSGTLILPIEKFVLKQGSTIKAKMTQDGFNGNNIWIDVVFSFSLSGVFI